MTVILKTFDYITNLMTKHLPLFILLLASQLLFAQENQVTDSSAYKQNGSLGGPKSIGAQLEADNPPKEDYYRVPIKVTTPWYEWKQELAKNTGLQLGINYTALYMRSSSVIDSETMDQNTASGVFDFQAIWTFLNRKEGKNQGMLSIKVNDRHAYAGLTAPMVHGFGESGYYGLPASGFTNYTMRITELHYSQYLMDNKVAFVIGKIDPSNYYNFHGLAIPWTAFMNYGSLLSSTINVHNPGFGVGAGWELTPTLSLKASFIDLYGDKYQDGDFFDLGDYFFEGKFQSMAEFSWSPSIGERYFKKISLTFWNTPDYINASENIIEEGQGLAFSAHWFFNDKFMPYARFAVSNGNGENLFSKKDVQLGSGYLMPSHDLIGASFSWAETNNPLGLENPKNQMTAEVFYRIQITPHLAITPDAQLIINPALDPTTDILWYGGIRGRVSF